MEISPLKLLYLLIFSVIFGAILGVINDINRLFRVMLGVKYSPKKYKKLYEIKLPFLKRSLEEFKHIKIKKVILPYVIFIQDILLFSCAAVGTVILNYYFNNGIFRFYTVVALVVGFLTYYFTIGKLVVFISEGIVFFVRAFVSIILFLLLAPIRIFFSFFGRNVKKIADKTQKSIANRRNKVYNKYKIRQVLDAADKGFINTH